MYMAFSFFDVFNYIGYVFGYILWFFFSFVKNFGVAIILFTIVIKLLLAPFSVKQQKSMAASAGLAQKQKELQKKYGQDKAKLNEEMTKLYQQEGVNPMGGCLTSFFPMILMLGVYYSVINPLQNTLHIAVDKVHSAVAMLGTIPGIGSSFNAYYGEIEIIKLFPLIKEQLTMFTPEEVSNIEKFHEGFNFLGLDLLGTPQASAFSSMLWIIPVLCFLSSVATTFVMQKIQGNQAQGPGCMKAMLYVMPLISAWIAYTVPAAVGFYWIISTILGFIQTVVLNHFYNIHIINAKKEAARVALRREQESKIQPVYQAVYDTASDAAKPSTIQQKTKKSKPQKSGSKKKGKDDSYLGKKK